MQIPAVTPGGGDTFQAGKRKRNSLLFPVYLDFFADFICNYSALWGFPAFRITGNFQSLNRELSRENRWLTVSPSSLRPLILRPSSMEDHARLTCMLHRSANSLITANFFIFGFETVS
jgi:hypothetical protein